MQNIIGTYNNTFGRRAGSRLPVPVTLPARTPSLTRKEVMWQR
ncbi:MAG: hypothetical protein PHN68_07545 [Prolixibacteraceae bacterium]|nr:hypothetical protein [Prolixibacteraceae bacterium]